LIRRHPAISRGDATVFLRSRAKAADFRDTLHLPQLQPGGAINRRLNIGA
jgi:hypothetical protein